jgi:superfamily II DNA/RNA helicase
VMISTDVLSEGLNLQDANIIVNYDLHWNPVRLMQRIGRVDRRMDPSKPVDYDKVYVYNFLPPAELERIIKLKQAISGKLMHISRALGIEAPVLDPKDETQFQDFYLNVGDGKMSVVEQLRREALRLEREHPELWAECAMFPNRIYSGKPGEKRHLFLCYRVVAGFEQDTEERNPVYDTKWYMVDRKTGEVTEDMEKIHNAIKCAQGTVRDLSLEKEDRTKLRKKVEDEEIKTHRFKAQIPQNYKDRLVCWMEA